MTRLPSTAALVASVVLAASSATAQIGATTPPGGSVPTQPSGAGSIAPRLRQFVRADYPADALAANLEGSVLLQISVDPAGAVTEVQVLEGLGPSLDAAAVAAARRFEFEPARRDGHLVAAVLRYRYRFSLAAGRAAQRPRPRSALHGVVRAEGERVLAGATLSVVLGDGPAREVVTDTEGRFRLEFDGVGEARVSVRAPGFAPLEVREALADRDDLELVYRLRTARSSSAAATPTSPAAAPTDDEGAEATVRGQRRPAREVTRQTLEFREILRMPGTGGDALRAIQNFPGVARALGGLLLVRGTTPQDTQIFVDGTFVPLIYHFGGLSAVISTELLDRIDFYPGNYGARYGRAQGGIVDVGFRSPRRQGYRIVGNINLIDASLFAEGAITRTLSFAVSFRRSYIDAILGAVLSGIEAVSITSLPVYWDYQALLEWRPSPRDRVRLAGFGSDDSLALILNRPNDMAPRFSGSFSTNIGFHSGQLLWDHTFSSRVSQRAVFSIARNQVNFGGGEVFGIDLSFLQFTGRYELSYQASRQTRVNLGLDIFGGPATIQFNGFRPPTEGQFFDPQNAPRVATRDTDTIYRPGVYAELELTPASRFRLIPSVRVDYARDADRSWVVQPRLAFRWEFVRDWWLKGGLGVYNQPPQPNQSSAAPNAFVSGATVGNPFLAMQRSLQYGLGFEHQFSRYVSLSAEGFYKDLDQQVVAQTSIQGASYLNTGVGRIYGAEVLFRHRPSSRFFGWVAYTLSRSERRDAPGMPYRIFMFDQTHILTLIGSFRLGRGWEVGARFRFVSGNPGTPIVGSIFNGDSGTYTGIPGRLFSERNAPFHQLDVRIDKTWSWRRGSLNLFLEVLNAYNNGNTEARQYSYNYLQRQPVTGLPFFPNLGMRVEY